MENTEVGGGDEAADEDIDGVEDVRSKGGGMLSGFTPVGGSNNGLSNIDVDGMADSEYGVINEGSFKPGPTDNRASNDRWELGGDSNGPVAR